MRTPRIWRQWTEKERFGLPEPWPDSGLRKRAGDGTDYELRTRTTAVDPLDQTATVEIRVEKRRGEQLLAAEEHALTMRAYFREELRLMLLEAGFADVVVRGDYTDDEPTADSDFLVFIGTT